MCWRKSLWTIALCFGLGLGLAPTVRSAHACSCIESSGWVLTLEGISAVDSAAEEEFWSSTANIEHGYYPKTVLQVRSGLLSLERVQ